MRDRLILTMNIFVVFFNIMLLFWSNYIVELIVSFLPQILFFEIIFFIVYFVILWKIKIVNIYNVINGQLSISVLTLVTTLILIVTFLMIGIKVYSFEFIYPSYQSLDKQDSNLRVVFFNKKYSNNNYGIISKKITELNPDIVAIAECEFGCETKILALENYKYISESVGDPNFPVVLLSKYKFDNISLDKNLDAVTAEIVVNEKKVSLFAVHPLSPVFPATYELRNTQLKALSKNINSSNNQYKIIFGDFNLSPWSNYYTEFVNSTKDIYDSAKGKGINTTWGTNIFFGIIPVRTHIDHIFLSKNISLKEFEVLGNYESDHNMIVTDIKF